MKTLFIILIIVLILVVLALSLFFIIQLKARRFLKTYFNASSFKDALENSEIEAMETPKSVSSMDSLYLNKIETDFPNLNMNELKSSSEKAIIETLKAIENKDFDALKESERVNSYIKSRIDDLGENNALYKDIKFHKTVVNKYERNSKIATIYLASSLEYFYKNGSEVGKKIQTRYICEYIYIIDAEKIGNVKALGLNCPNCGAPIKTLGNKYCEYCSTGVVDTIKKNWILNNIKEY